MWILASVLLLVCPAVPGFASPRAADAASISLDASGALLYAPTVAADTGMLHAFGSRIGAGFSLGVRDSRVSWIPFRAEVDFFSIGDSSFSPALKRFSAFWGLRLAALAGVSIPLGTASLETLAGAAVSASRFTNLSAVTAYPSLVAEARLLIPIGAGAAAGASRRGSPGIILTVPLEYMSRATARTVAAGIGLGASIRLPGTGAKP